MMDISYIAVNRIVEKQMAANGKYRKEIERSGKIVLSSGRQMSDAELLEKLESFNVKLDKKLFSELYEKFLSAEEMSERIVKKHHLRPAEMEIDWIWICLPLLWERWFPERPSLEMIRCRMDIRG